MDVSGLASEQLVDASVSPEDRGSAPRFQPRSRAGRPHAHHWLSHTVEWATHTDNVDPGKDKCVAHPKDRDTGEVTPTKMAINSAWWRCNWRCRSVFAIHMANKRHDHNRWGWLICGIRCSKRFNVKKLRKTRYTSTRGSHGVWLSNFTVASRRMEQIVSFGEMPVGKQRQSRRRTVRGILGQARSGQATVSVPILLNKKRTLLKTCSNQSYSRR